MNAAGGGRALLNVARVSRPEHATWKCNRAQPRILLIGTFNKSENRSSCCKQTTYPISNRYKDGLSAETHLASLSLHERQSVRHQVRKHIGVKHHDDANDRAERDGVPENVAEDDAFVAHLLCCGGGDGDGLRVHHFTHHAAGAIG